MRQLISEYKLQVRRLIRRNKMQAPKKRRVIKDDKVQQMLSFWKAKSNRLLWIREIKAGVWKNQNAVPPWDATISKSLKKDLGMSYRMLSWFHPKTQTNDHIRVYWEAVIIQTILGDMGWEAIFIDEFNISSHRNKFKGWALKDHKPAIATKLDSFSMYFVLAVSTKHIYGILANSSANTADIFVYFLDCLLKHREKLFKMSNNSTFYVIDNASIHKTENVDEYAKRNEISLLTIPSYSPALNGAETVIQAIKAKVNKQRMQGR